MLLRKRNTCVLTYTDAGAELLCASVCLILSVPMLTAVNIYTFHAFCNEIIQENLEYFGKLNLEPLSELEWRHAVSRTGG